MCITSTLALLVSADMLLGCWCLWWCISANFFHFRLPTRPVPGHTVVMRLREPHMLPQQAFVLPSLHASTNTPCDGGRGVVCWHVAWLQACTMCVSHDTVVQGTCGSADLLLLAGPARFKLKRSVAKLWLPQKPPSLDAQLKLAVRESCAATEEATTAAPAPSTPPAAANGSAPPASSQQDSSQAVLQFFQLTQKAPPRLKAQK